MVGKQVEMGGTMTAEIARLVAKRLTPRQQQTLELLVQGCGVRETARRLGVSHPAIIKHRHKIARLAAVIEKQDRATAPVTQFAGQPTGYGGARLPAEVTISKRASL